MKHWAWMNHKLESISGRNISNFRYADDTTLVAESEEELKSLLMRMRGELKSWLETQHLKNEDHGIWSHHYFMANRRGKREAVTDFVFLGSKSTVDSDCSHEIKRRLLLEKKSLTNLDSMLKSREIIRESV